MWLLIIGTVLAIALAVLLSIIGNQDGEWYNTVASYLGIILGIAASICVIAICIFGFEWEASEYKSKIINREYNSEYTREEIFYASDVIETIRQLDRKRFEINGNIMGGERTAP